MATTNHINSIWVNNKRKRNLIDFFMFWKKKSCPHVNLPTPLHLIESCKGLILNKQKVKSILFSTDIALIENNDADAILAVYPFAPSQNIIKTLIEFSKKPVICGIGGGITHSKVSPSISLTLISTIAFLGFLIGPPVIGFIAEILDLRYSYLLFSVFGIIMMILASRSKILKEN